MDNQKPIEALPLKDVLQISATGIVASLCSVCMYLSRAVDVYRNSPGLCARIYADQDNNIFAVGPASPCLLEGPQNSRARWRVHWGRTEQRSYLLTGNREIPHIQNKLSKRRLLIGQING